MQPPQYTLQNICRQIPKVQAIVMLTNQVCTVHMPGLCHAGQVDACGGVLVLGVNQDVLDAWIRDNWIRGYMIQGCMGQGGAATQGWRRGLATMVRQAVSMRGGDIRRSRMSRVGEYRAGGWN